jgi:hypothetical protein
MEPNSYQGDENIMTMCHSVTRTEIHCPLPHATQVWMLLERRNWAQHKPILHAKLEGGDEWNINENQGTYEAYDDQSVI